jgi:Nucleotidyltransferase domain
VSGVNKIVRAGLQAINVEDSLAEIASFLVPEDTVGLLVYGSRARGDHTPSSDLDLLVIVPRPVGSRTAPKVSVSCYTVEQLRCANGTLFGMHLARDAVAVYDPDETLGSLLASMGQPDPVALLARAKHFSAILDVTADELNLYLGGLVRLARYLLRTVIYAVAIAQGSPCFSVRELAIRFVEPELADLLSSDPSVQSPNTTATFRDLVERLSSLLGALPSNAYGSLRSLIVAEWADDRDRATLATLAIARRSDGFDYAELPKVLL